MVTKAIEKAQNTVEQRNAEIRKDVLKYDEVMNEQRKVIYARRMQVLDGEDLRDRTLEVLASALEGVVRSFCPTEFQEDWDGDGLVREARVYYPTKFTPAELLQAERSDDVYESLLAEAVEYYEQREQSMPAGPDTMRQLEREIMMQIIDQRWREHLAEMDYLREGINLRAMGQQDPLVAWTTEGYEMFGQLMAAIDDDFVKYVMHAVVVEEQQEVDLQRAQYAAPDDPVQGSSGVNQALAQEAAAQLGEAQAAQANQPSQQQQQPAELDDTPMQPIVKSENEKLGRNDPCWCGSGKKFKMCHGR
jgi:preprotein translocase subunit SecA